MHNPRNTQAICFTSSATALLCHLAQAFSIFSLWFAQFSHVPVYIIGLPVKYRPLRTAAPTTGCNHESAKNTLTVKTFFQSPILFHSLREQPYVLTRSKMWVSILKTFKACGAFC